MDDIAVSFPGGKRVDARVGDFMIHTDQPVHQGGDADPTTKLPSRVRIDVQLPRSFPERYRAAIVRAAGACKIKKQSQPGWRSKWLRSRRTMLGLGHVFR